MLEFANCMSGAGGARSLLKQIDDTEPFKVLGSLGTETGGLTETTGERDVAVKGPSTGTETVTGCSESDTGAKWPYRT